MNKKSLEILAEDTLGLVTEEIMKASYLLDNAMDDYFFRHTSKSDPRRIAWDFDRYKSFVWAASDTVIKVESLLKTYNEARAEMKKPLTDDQINSAAGQKPDITDSISDVS